MNTDTAQLDSLTQRLETVATNLHGYLEERARELAEPYIAVAEKLANRRIAEAEAEAQRERDLVAELRRQVEALDRLHQSDRAALRAVAQLHAAAVFDHAAAGGWCLHCGPAVPHPCATVLRLPAGLTADFRPHTAPT